MLPLEQALNYDLSEVAERLAFEKGLETANAAQHVYDLKAWLWASALCLELREEGHHSLPPNLIITPELRDIDEAWHVFLVFTRKYREFCMTCLGRYIDHEPASAEERVRYAALRVLNPGQAFRERQELLRPQLQFLFERLDTEMVRRWYLKVPANNPAP